MVRDFVIGGGRQVEQRQEVALVTHITGEIPVSIKPQINEIGAHLPSRGIPAMAPVVKSFSGG